MLLINISNRCIIHVRVPVFKNELDTLKRVSENPMFREDSVPLKFSRKELYF